MTGTAPDARILAIRELGEAWYFVRLAVAGLAFLGLTYLAGDTLVRAIWHIPYDYKFGTGGYWHGTAPTIGNATSVVLLGPVAQLAVGAIVALVMRHRRPTWGLRLRAATWWLIPLDVLTAIVLA